MQKSDSDYHQVISASEECEHIPRAESTFIKPLNEWTREQTEPGLSRKQGGIDESQLLPMSSATSSTNDNPIATMPLARIAR